MKINRMIAVIAAACMISGAQSVTADDLPAEFENLTTLNIDSTLDKYFSNITIHFDKSISTLIDSMYYFTDRDGRIVDEDLKFRCLIVTKIDRNDDTRYTIDFYPGMSVDPHFRIYRNTDGRLKGLTNSMIITGTQLIVPGDGFLYSSGHTNNTFDQKRLFRVEGDEIIEVVQPYYYVGLQSVTNREIVLRSLAGPVVTLPQGTPVTVLLKQIEPYPQFSYLLKTDFGLVGWVHFKPRELYMWNKPNPIEGLYSNGD